MRSIPILGVVAACIVTPALAQSASLANGDFELNSSSSLTGGLTGWTNNTDTAARKRTLTDSLSPPALVRTGNQSISIGPIPARPPGGTFFGFTTDTRNLLDPNFNYYDVALDWWGGDTLEAIAWYAIPASDPLNELPPMPWPTDVPIVNNNFPFPPGSAPAMLKLDIKGAGNGNQNNASHDPYEFARSRELRARDFLIGGHTNSQWRQYTISWKARTPDRKGWKDVTEDRSAAGEFPLPPADSPPGTLGFPNRVKVTFGRFNTTTGDDTGTIFWDSLTYRQFQSGPARCNLADIATVGGTLTPDGLLTADDIIAYIGAFFANNIAVADLVTVGGNRPGDGLITADDLIYFLGQFFSPCN
jgi:hypothetical protein